jgi:hypothetical protein
LSISHTIFLFLSGTACCAVDLIVRFSSQAIVFLDDVRRLCAARRAHSQYPPQGPPNPAHAANARRAASGAAGGHVPTEVCRAWRERIGEEREAQRL